MALSQTPNQQARQELDSTKCCVCGNAKAKGQSFCKSCYFKLDVPMRQALYKSFTHGYEEAYLEAKEWLVAELKAKGKK